MNMRPLRKFVVVVAGFCLHLTLGSGNSIGNMATYIISYLHSIGVDAALTDSIWIFAMVEFGHGLVMSMGGFLEGKIGSRITTYLGSIIASTGVALTYITINTTLPLIIISYGLIFGLGIGIAYASPMTTAMKWFPDHKGLVNGIIVSGFGLGTFIFTQVQTFYLNPENTTVNDEGFFTDCNLLRRVPQAFLILAAIFSSIQFLCCAVIKEPAMSDENNCIISKTKDTAEKEVVVKTFENFAYTADNLEKNIVNVNNITRISEKNDENKRGKDYRPLEILKCKQFYILWFTLCLNEPVIVFISAMYKAYGQTFIKDDKYMVLIGAVSSIFNSVSRILWGWLLDKSSYKICMLVLTFSAGVLVATLCLTPYGGKAMYTIWIWLIYLVISGNFVLFPTCVADTFGLKYASVNYGLIFTSNIISSPCAALLTQFLSSIVGWNGLFGIMATLSFSSTILTMFYVPIE